MLLQAGSDLRVSFDLTNCPICVGRPRYWGNAVEPAVLNDDAHERVQDVQPSAFCGNCGHPLGAGVRFCGGCGAPVAANQDVQVDPAPQAKPHRKPRPAKARRRLSKRMIILLSVLGLLVIGGGAAALIVFNILRGGADTPEQAVTKSIDSIQKKDLVGLFTMVAPHERDALVRVQNALVQKAKDVNIAQAAQKVSTKDSGQGGGDLSFDGMDISITGVQPSVSQVSDDVAVIHMSSGQIHFHLDPAQTKGALRSIFDAVQNPQVVDQTVNISDLGSDHSGLSVVANKTDGRWYLNLSMSVLEAVNNSQGTSRGSVPATMPAGLDTPQAAARSAVTATQTLKPSDLAPYLQKDEAEALYLYGNLWNKIYNGSWSFSFGNVDFTEGPHDGNKAQAYVSQVNINPSSGDRVTLTDKCLTGAGMDSSNGCLNGSAYSSYYSSGSVNWLSALGSRDGKFALTTVNEDGKWKVSILDTAADHLVDAINGLTREQALALTTLARSEDPSGVMTLGQSANIDFNNAGYAVKTLHLDKSTALQLNKNANVGSYVLFSADGKKTIDGGNVSSYISSSLPTSVPPGDYKAVIWAGSDFNSARAKDGNNAHVSTSLTLSQAVQPSTIDGSRTESVTVSAYSDKTVYLNVASKDAGPLQIAVTSYGTGSTLIATVDGKSYQVDGTQGIPVDVGNHTLTLRQQESSGSSSYSSYASSVNADLSFQNQ